MQEWKNVQRHIPHTVDYVSDKRLGPTTERKIQAWLNLSRISAHYATILFPVGIILSFTSQNRPGDIFPPP